MSHSFQVDLRGVVELLSRHLYSSPGVYLRELLQNAADALTARAALDPAARGGIRIVTGADPDGRPTVEVADDGAGLTPDEVERFLATIGRSSKVDELGFPRVDQLGQFGIGLFACFLVSDEVTVVSRSARGGPAVRFEGRADGSYTLTGIDEDVAVGTTVRVRARPDGAELLTTAAVRELAWRYGSLLPWPVTLLSEDGPEPVGGRGLPWQWEFDSPGERHAALLEWGREVFGTEFYDVLPIKAAVAGLEGLAFVLPWSPSPSTRQSHRVYVKRMLLSEGQHRLLPDWAFFVRCVVDAGELRPTASREALYDDEALAATREALGIELRRYLVRLAATNPDRLAHLLALHHVAIKALAVHDREFLAMMVRWLPFETSAGEMTMNEYRRRWPVVHYTPSRDTFRQLAPVAAAQGLCVVNGGYTHDSDLIEQLPLVLPGTRVEPLEPGDLLPTFATVPEGIGTQLLAAGRAALARHGCGLELRSFQPASVPTMYVPADDELERSIDAARQAGPPDGAWAGVLASLAPGMAPGAEFEADEPVALLCLNAASPLVAGLLEVTDPGLAATGVELLYVQALLLGHHPLRAPELDLLTGSLADLLQRSLGRPIQATPQEEPAS
jgi:molecular chaperone HtpG